MMSKTFRLIDDISSINSDGVFSQHVSDIYPSSLTLNKENEEDSEANILDLKVIIKDNKFNVSVYDKRDAFPFKIVQFSGKDSNVPRSSVLGVFQSQIIRYFRICSDLDSFVDRLRNIILKFIQLGFEKRLLKSRFKCICSTHDFRRKFTEIDMQVQSLFD